MDVENVIQFLLEQQAQFEARKAELDTRDAELDGRETELAARQAEFDARQAEFVAHLAKFDEDIARINSVLLGVAATQQRNRRDAVTLAEAKVGVGKPH